MTTKTIEKSAQRTRSPGTIQVRRVFKAPPERVYKAILDPAAICKWFPPNGYTCTVEHLEAQVGGSYRMSFTNFSTGRSHTFSGKVLDLQPNALVRMSDTFDDPKITGEIQTTYTLKKVSLGTALDIVQENIPAAFPPEECFFSWQECLELLARLVEPEIPDPF